MRRLSLQALKFGGARSPRRFLLFSVGSSLYTIIALAALVLTFAGGLWHFYGGGLPGLGDPDGAEAMVEGAAIAQLEPLSIPRLTISASGEPVFTGSLDPATGSTPPPGDGAIPPLPGPGDLVPPLPPLPPLPPEDPGLPPLPDLPLPDLPLPELPGEIPLPEIPDTGLPLPDLPPSIPLPQLPAWLESQLPL